MQAFWLSTYQHLNYCDDSFIDCLNSFALFVQRWLTSLHKCIICFHIQLGAPAFFCILSMTGQVWSMRTKHYSFRNFWPSNCNTSFKNISYPAVFLYSLRTDLESSLQFHWAVFFLFSLSETCGSCFNFWLWYLSIFIMWVSLLSQILSSSPSKYHIISLFSHGSLCVWVLWFIKH